MEDSCKLRATKNQVNHAGQEWGGGDQARRVEAAVPIHPSGQTHLPHYGRGFRAWAPEPGTRVCLPHLWFYSSMFLMNPLVAQFPLCNLWVNEDAHGIFPMAPEKGRGTLPLLAPTSGQALQAYRPGQY